MCVMHIHVCMYVYVYIYVCMYVCAMQAQRRLCNIARGLRSEKH
jgi:hypothetical protein